MKWHIPLKKGPTKIVRTVKRFAVFPKITYYDYKKYCVWLEFYWQDQRYIDGAWRNDSDYPIIGDNRRYK